MRRGWFRGGTAVAGAAMLLAPAGLGMTAHMMAHMAAVAVAAPLLAWAMAGTAFDPAERWPRLVSPLAMGMVELVVVWAWHLPAAREAADAWMAVGIVEQMMFLGAGYLLWSAAFGTRAGAGSARRAAGIAALLLTSMHMTLLGALVALAPRPLYATMALHGAHGGLDPLADQQLGGVVMLIVGGASYLIGGLVMLGGLLGPSQEAEA